MLTNHSFNALLKTLEEPLPHVKFLLATTDPQKLPVTVLSRCLQFNLKRLSVALINARMAHILAAEQLVYEPAALQLLAQAADGSMRDALSLLDQLLAFGDGVAREPRTGFRMTLIRMLAFRPEPPAPVTAAAPVALPPPVAVPPPLATRPPVEVAAAAPGAAADAPPPADWSSLVAALELDGPTRMLALNCALLTRGAGLIRLTPDPPNAAAHTRTREQRLAQALSQHLGEAVRVEIVTGRAVVQTPAQAQDRAAQQALPAAG